MKAAASRTAFVLLAGVAAASALYAQAPGTSAQPAAEEQVPAAAVPSSTVHEPGTGVRIVRLSQTRGQVQLDRNVDRGFEAAFTNMPITEHAQIKTAEGVAEIEFEDNSTLRLTPNTVVDFPQLRRTSSGSTLSAVHVTQGLVYVSLANTKGNQFSLSYGQRQIALDPSAHIQLSVGATESRLAVLDGAVQLEDPSGATVASVGKKHSLFLDPASTAPPASIAKMEKTPYDDWDKTATDYHKQYAKASAYGASSAFYGVSDMNYYGSFVNLDGCGSVWRPYFASAGWDPFANGVMAYYSGAGYSFVSPYPWGWTPYHSGNWQMCGASGWGWRPDGSFVGLANAAKAHHPIHEPGQPLPVTSLRASIVAVNTKPLTASQASPSQAFAFRQDSAGLGVPRQVFGDLKEISTNVQHQGSFVVPVAAPAGIVATRGERQTASSQVAAATNRSSGSAGSGSGQASAASFSSGSVSGSSHGGGAGPSASSSASSGGGHH